MDAAFVNQTPAKKEEAAPALEAPRQLPKWEVSAKKETSQSLIRKLKDKLTLPSALDKIVSENFSVAIDVYLKRSALGLRNSESECLVKSICNAVASNFDLVDVAFEKRDNVLSFHVLNALVNADTESIKRGEAWWGKICKIFGKAASGDNHYASLAAICGGNLLFGQHPLLKQNFCSILGMAENDTTGAYALLAACALIEFGIDFKNAKPFIKIDADYYLSVLNYISEKYERGELESPSILVGASLALSQDMNQNLLMALSKNPKLIAAMIFKGGIVRKLLGSPKSMVEMASGKKFPPERLMELLCEDAKTRAFCLMCLSKAIEVRKAMEERQRNFEAVLSGEPTLLNSIEMGGLWQFDKGITECLKRMNEKQRAKLVSVFGDPVLRKQYLESDSTAAGAKHFIDIMVKNGYIKK